ncbi:MAG: hypothetical protein PHI97_26960 [Desulfobulbus sp.]|nr:hypothetical protein [Desulfobulbus sp.]
MFIFFVIAAFFQPVINVQAKNITTEQLNNNQLVRFYYQQVEKTAPSTVDEQQHIQVIRERLNCYFANNEYTERVNNCNGPYVKDIVALARQSLTARPSLGAFVRILNICPVLYNMCMGNKNDGEQCILFERRCIDHVLDKYWRGNWKHTLKEMQ